MLKLSKAYCCEYLACNTGTCRLARAAWRKQFGRKRWTTLIQVVNACYVAHRSNAYRAHTWVQAIFTDLAQTQIAGKAHYDAHCPCNDGKPTRAYDLAEARRITANYDGEFDFC